MAGQSVLVRLGRGQRQPFTTHLGLLGVHQRQNAAVALAAALKLTPHGLALTTESVRAGLEQVRLPGRFEIVPGSPIVVLDGAHNRDSAVALARSLVDTRLTRPRWLVLGVLRDKDARAILRALLPAVDGIVVTAPASPRALAAEALAEAARRAGARDIARARTVAEGLERAQAAAGPSGAVVATGSFAVVAEARAALGLADPGP